MAFFSSESMKGFTSIKPDDGTFQLIPNGRYTMQAVKTDIKPTKNGNGSYVEVFMKITEGDYKNRQIIKRFNWENTNATAMSIGRAQFRNLVLACGIPGDLRNSDEVLNIPVTGEVYTQKGTNGYNDSNDVKFFKPVGSVPQPTIKTASNSTVQTRPIAQNDSGSFADAYNSGNNNNNKSWDFAPDAF